MTINTKLAIREISISDRTRVMTSLLLEGTAPAARVTVFWTNLTSNHALLARQPGVARFARFVSGTESYSRSYHASTLSFARRSSGRNPLVASVSLRCRARRAMRRKLGVSSRSAQSDCATLRRNREATAVPI